MPGIFCMFGIRLIIQGFGGQSLMKFGHISVPDRQRIGSSGKSLGASGRVKSDPDTGGIISSITDKPSVQIIVGGAGLSCSGHAGNGISVGGTACQNPFQNIGHLMSCG